MDLPVSPLAPERFPVLPKVGGIEITTHSLGLYKGKVRDDLLVVHFPNGAFVGGIFTNSSTRSDDVDLCRANLKTGGGHARRRPRPDSCRCIFDRCPHRRAAR